MSTGEARKFLIARAMVNDPCMLVLDEPTSELDPAGTALVADAIAHVAREIAAGVLLVEHHADLIFDIPVLIETLSRTLTLEPGDIIATGTPAGVGMGFKPPKYLKQGDRVAVTIDPIGTLENPVG